MDIVMLVAIIMLFLYMFIPTIITVPVILFLIQHKKNLVKILIYSVAVSLFATLARIIGRVLLIYSELGLTEKIEDLLVLAITGLFVFIFSLFLSKKQLNLPRSKAIILSILVTVISLIMFYSFLQTLVPWHKF
ncbi:MAG: hypothetical protein KGZ63_01605 [Clostridiales bacterium]|nr:hypothetical protein [Clostridiales bacterium]